MRSNIDQTRSELENRAETNRVEIDGDSEDVILRAMVDDITDDFETFVDEKGLDVINTKEIGLGFGSEVELR